MTNLCARLSNELKAHGWQVTGIISPIVYLQGHRIGIDAIDLSNGDRRRLADIRSLPENQPDIFDQVVLVDVEVTRRLHFDVDAAVS
jgi:nucleoside-triphosphatase THEP1